MLAVDETYLKLHEIAERLQVSDRTVTRWIKSGELPAYKFANEYRITETDLKAFLEKHRAK